MGIGDELMAAGAAKRHFERTRHPVRITRQSGGRKWFEIWDGLPYLVPPGDRRVCDEIEGKDGQGLRPYIRDKTEQRWYWKAYDPAPAEILFTGNELALAEAARSAIVVEPNLKAGASPNKNWGWERWQALLRLRPDLDWLQLGPEGTRLLRGARFLQTATFRIAAAALSVARAAVLTEGGLHHAAAATGTPAVVLFGGFIAPAVTGYRTQTNLFTGTGLGCGMRVPCKHCQAAMAAIEPAQVLEKLEELLETDRRSVAA